MKFKWHPKLKNCFKIVYSQWLSKAYKLDIQNSILADYGLQTKNYFIFNKSKFLITSITIDLFP